MKHIIEMVCPLCDRAFGVHTLSELVHMSCESVDGRVLRRTMTHNDRKERNAEIVRLRNEGYSFDEIGRRTGVTAEWARQVYTRRKK